jgi:hypothetical protein
LLEFCQILIRFFFISFKNVTTDADLDPVHSF